MLPDSYFLDSFIGGLKPFVKPFVRAFKPTTISQDIEYARLQEEFVSLTNQKSFKLPVANTGFKSSSSVPMLANAKPSLLPTPQTTIVNQK